MHTRLKHLSKFAVWALIVAEPSSSFAKTDNSGIDAGTVVLDNILVVGKRASLASAQEIKRDKMEIVDSVVGDDINKLPDINVTDALSRITGVDCSFVHDIPADRNKSELVKAIISIAQALHLDLVAEGVETSEQADYLNTHGCLVGQGYLFGKPMPYTQFEAMLGRSGQ